MTIESTNWSLLFDILKKNRQLNDPTDDWDLQKSQGIDGEKKTLKITERFEPVIRLVIILIDWETWKIVNSMFHSGKWETYKRK